MESAQTQGVQASSVGVPGEGSLNLCTWSLLFLLETDPHIRHHIHCLRHPHQLGHPENQQGSTNDTAGELEGIYPEPPAPEQWTRK